VDAKDLEVLNLLHYDPIDENGGVLGPPFLLVHSHLLCLDQVEGEVVVLAPHGQVSDLLPIGCLVVVPGRTIMSEQGVQEWTENAPLRGPCVED
jgi:hypothetical protein